MGCRARTAGCCGRSCSTAGSRGGSCAGRGRCAWTSRLTAPTASVWRSGSAPSCSSSCWSPPAGGAHLAPATPAAAGTRLLPVPLVLGVALVGAGLVAGWGGVGARGGGGAALAPAGPPSGPRRRPGCWPCRPWSRPLPTWRCRGAARRGGPATRPGRTTSCWCRSWPCCFRRRRGLASAGERPQTLQPQRRPLHEPVGELGRDEAEGDGHQPHRQPGGRGTAPSRSSTSPGAGSAGAGRTRRTRSSRGGARRGDP